MKTYLNKTKTKETKLVIDGLKADLFVNGKFTMTFDTCSLFDLLIDEMYKIKLVPNTDDLFTSGLNRRLMACKIAKVASGLISEMP